MLNSIRILGPVTITEVRGNLNDTTTYNIVRQSNVANVDNVRYSRTETTESSKSSRRERRRKPESTTAQEKGGQEKEKRSKQTKPMHMNLDDLVDVDPETFDPFKIFDMIDAGLVPGLGGCPPTASRIDEAKVDTIEDYTTSNDECDDWYDEDEDEKKPSSKDPSFVTLIKQLQEKGFDSRKVGTFAEGTKRVIKEAAKAGPGQHLANYTSERTHHSANVNGAPIAPATYRRVNGDYNINRVVTESINNNCYNVRNVKLKRMSVTLGPGSKIWVQTGKD